MITGEMEMGDENSEKADDTDFRKIEVIQNRR